MENKITYRLFLKKIITFKSDFFFVFAAQLDEVFSNGWIYEDIYKDTGEIIVSVDGTCGWSEALKHTCEILEEFGFMDYWKWYDSLNWSDSDVVDGIIGDLLVAVVYDENGDRMYSSRYDKN